MAARQKSHPNRCSPNPFGPGWTARARSDESIGRAEDSSRAASPPPHRDLAAPVQAGTSASRHRGRCGRRRPRGPAVPRVRGHRRGASSGGPVRRPDRPPGLRRTRLLATVDGRTRIHRLRLVRDAGRGMHPANVAEAVTYTSAIALAAGAVLALAGLLRVGWVAEFLSKPIVTGFVFGLTILVIIGELPNLLGIPVSPGDVLHRISGLALNIDQVDPRTVTVGVSALAVLFIGSRLLPRVPWALVVLALGLAASHWLDLPAQGVAVVGAVPKGSAPPSSRWCH